ncbi:MAG: hypothetical protein ACKOW2_08705 [Sphingobacteriaceae bacterium]
MNKSCETCFNYYSKEYYCGSFTDKEYAEETCIKYNFEFYAPNRETLENDLERLQKILADITKQFLILEDENESLKTKLATLKVMLEEKDEAYNCMGHTNSNEIKRFIKHLLKEIKNEN